MPRPTWTLRQADLAGAGIVVALAAWLAVGAGGNGRPGPVLALLAALVAATAIGRALADRGIPVAGPVAAAVLATFALTFPNVLRAAGAPTGYANANATLAAVGALAAVAAARMAAPGRRRQLHLVVAAALAVMTAASGSVAGTAALGVAAGLLVANAPARRAPAVPLTGMALVVLAVGLTAAAAIVRLDETPAELRAGDEVRIDLWSAALDLVRDEPIRGLGVGAFEERNPVSADADLRWVHQEYLELAVEGGAPALVLTFALIAWTAARLWTAAPDAPVLVASAAAAATVVGLHGAVDHVWHAPAPMVLTAALVGAATSAAPPEPAANTLREQRRGAMGLTVHCRPRREVGTVPDGHREQGGRRERNRWTMTPPARSRT